MVRPLIITADDFGIGLETSRGILDLAEAGRLTSTVLLVNSPFAEASVEMWRKRSQPIELGWHPVLTLDQPVLPANQVPSLVQADGRFYPLGVFLKRLVLGQVAEAEIALEFQAQLARYRELVGANPENVNGHHHVHIFAPVRRALTKVLHEVRAKPFVRRVVEPWSTLRKVPGARVKRLMLSHLGGRAASAQERAGFPGASAVLGITDPPYVHDPEFFHRWLAEAPSEGLLELTCHPGCWDESLAGRDGTLVDGQLQRRVREAELLGAKDFAECLERYEVLSAKAAQKRGFSKMPNSAQVSVGVRVDEGHDKQKSRERQQHP
ncbi:MAG: carbohydrate deacetylase [Fimbriiglobus sp.]